MRVLMWRCDRCGSVASVKADSKSIPFPPGWVEVWGADLCGGCNDAFQSLLKKQEADRDQWFDFQKAKTGTAPV